MGANAGYIAFCYTKMYQAVRNSGKRVAQTLGERSAEKAARDEQKAGLLMLACTLSFVACWTSVMASFLLGMFGISLSPTWDAVSATLGNFSALVTPLLYGVFSLKIRRGVLNILRCRPANMNATSSVGGPPSGAGKMQRVAMETQAASVSHDQPSVVLALPTNAFGAPNSSSPSKFISSRKWPKPASASAAVAPSPPVIASS